MSLMEELEAAVGNEYLISHINLLLNTNQNTQRQAHSNKIVSIQRQYQPDSNKIVNIKRVNA
ncbi:hypothetical protein LEAN103870_18570 [Legionella anisa]|uniref:Uncharacterized protein n=1 Tax=Legionella anisa TaxID=28082 RepID=A0AAX0WX06_9GAMM|nr:hypothetical protein [Legionella anisa]AWN72443.1 hypothetical protein DLD14_00450 [Legionella anisa]KTC74902.1 hypothetical protein Lani_0701 [Legionella anisa]MBN5937325.1 hypothetical protein [Legionella anisa]MCW8423205.1 hypothetical protein [Legionella anisa]MCW8446723.1 hypothetical protein [Legionella anisa]